MNNTNQIKMTEDELKEIRDIQKKFQDTHYQFGNIYLEKIQVEEAIKTIAEKETSLISTWKSLQKEENELINKILKKYGEGSLNLKDGIFISEKPV